MLLHQYTTDRKLMPWSIFFLHMEISTALLNFLCIMLNISILHLDIKTWSQRKLHCPSYPAKIPFTVACGIDTFDLHIFPSVLYWNALSSHKSQGYVLSAHANKLSNTINIIILMCKPVKVSWYVYVLPIICCVFIVQKPIRR